MTSDSILLMLSARNPPSAVAQRSISILGLPTETDPAAGPAGEPDLTIETPFELWMDIMTGKANGHEIFIGQAGPKVILVS